MKIYRSLQELPVPMTPTVAAIGNFDGVHRGHLEVIRECWSGRADWVPWRSR